MHLYCLDKNMNHLQRRLRQALPMAAAALLITALTGCGGGLDPILGTPAVSSAPTVTVTSPLASATGVDTHTLVQATFSKPMSSATITASSFTLACPAATPVAATVSYVAVSQIATLTPTAALPPNTTCVATVGTGVQDSTGIPLAAAFGWSFSTGAATALDTTRPTVTVTVPATGALAVANNARITATFSEAMNPATLTTASVTLTNTTLGAAVPGTVTYGAGSRTVTFTPTAAALANSSLYTATVTSAATDVAGNALAGNTAVLPGSGNHVWTFTTGVAADTTPPTVSAVSPLVGAAGVCLSKVASATFSEAMDPATVNATNFTVTDAGAAVAGSVSYDAASQVATFTPTAAGGFAASKTFTATIAAGAGGVKDLAGNPLAVSRVWTFSTGTQACTGAVNLGTAATFGAFGGAAGVTNQGLNTIVGGNLGSTAACTLITGFHDAVNAYTETTLNKGGVNGSINCAPPAPGTLATLAVATQARADAQTAYNTLAALPAGSDPGAGQLGGLVLAPGVYTAAGGTFALTTGNLTLDAQGDPNAVWVFQSSAALTVGLPATARSVLLLNGAQARNVFWQVGSAARIEVGSTMVGTIIAPAGVTVSTAGQVIQTTLIGRAIGLTASVTLVNTTIVAP
jgi:hypothetical protein